jgi:flagellar protein FliJ
MSLPTLIRLTKFKLDEKRTQLNQVRELAEHLSNNCAMLEQEYQRELAIASSARETGASFQHFKALCAERKANLLVSIKELEDQASLINDEVLDLFQELKRYEITNDERALNSRKKTDRREQSLADELALRSASRAGRG